MESKPRSRRVHLLDVLLEALERRLARQMLVAEVDPKFH
jgi:hypothetical protein